MVGLRPYQAEAVQAVYRHLRDRDDNPVVVIPTGGGKTALMSTICDDAARTWDGRVLVQSHVEVPTLAAPEPPKGVARRGSIRAAVADVDMDIKVVVLNVGSENNPPVRKGCRYWIHRGGEFITEVKVVSVEKTMCAAEIVPPDTRKAVKIGDGARLKF